MPRKEYFFPRLDGELDSQCDEPVSMKPCASPSWTTQNQEELLDCKTPSEVLKSLEKKVPNLKIFTYERLDQLKRAAIFIECEVRM